MTTYREAQKIPLTGLSDRRRKLTDDDKLEILRLYQVEKLGIREIARRYEKKCSRRLVQFVLFPNRLKAMQKVHAKNQHWKTYHNRKKSTEAVRNWRNYKYKLFNQ